MSDPARRLPSIPALQRWWRVHVRRDVDHEAVLAAVRDDAGWNGRYAFMILMSAGIAVLGLLLSSPAVVIGAMLISPLMGPIIGLGFGLATFDWPEIRASFAALILGTVLAIGFTALVVALSPLQNVTDEIAARTRPNLFDLVVALFSALAGGYAVIHGRAGTVVGVAIATALMPPLAVVGFGLATQNWTVFGGALLLFVTNLMTIALSAAMIARVHGFGSHLSPQHTLVQTVLVFGSLGALALPLGVSLRQIAWESLFTRQAREVLTGEFGSDARLSQVDITYAVDRIRIEATVLTPRLNPAAEKHAAAVLRQRTDRPVTVSIDQYRVGTGAEAEAAQIANAAGRLGDRTAERLTEQLALVSGAPREAILIDADQRHAVVRAQPLEGATLSAYRTLETRVAAVVPGWRIELVPPMGALPPVELTDGVPDPNGLALLGWAGARTGVPLTLSGPETAVDAAIRALTRTGVAASAGSVRSGDTLTASWATAAP
ncbi:hypothetical protein COC42_12910 [Sphingomonas spermidinifaciens]|uniref:TIGR00341 family protein n=1 Tax=Sphingomonas spermidinifaciens TaxID=1141889 RepID=A0A2A4AZF6_9SPHN|nr:DUF389 domain-containing protein [Sphingomonas spermidinifaciens]PCD02333.1 hypothetical protein COC42_12910 [Sphingomonas spermidinifaciens]